MKQEQDGEIMDTGELFYDDFDEEGEIHSSGDEQRFLDSGSVVQPRKSIFGGSMTNTKDPHQSEELKKLERAKRFSIPISKSETIRVNNESMAQLHKSLGIDHENERHYRFNAIHVRGTQDMSTEDVFDYFRPYTPSHIEWINDISCNVVWVDDISAAGALLNLSKEIKNLDKIHSNADPFEKDLKKKDYEMEFDCDVDAVDARDIKVAVPPGFWRIGVPSEKSPGILLRLATRSDRKQKNAEKNSEYYKRYGNPHFGNIAGIVSTTLRTGVFNNKFGRFKNSNGAVDDKKNPWGHLAQEWSESGVELYRPKTDVRSRITLKRPHQPSQEDLRFSITKQRVIRSRQAESCSSESDYDENEGESRVKLCRMKMYADDEEKNDNRKINSQVRVPEDLRNKIDRRRRNKEMLNKLYKGSPSKRHRTEYRNIDIEDEYDKEERESSNWALEQYSDLRESLDQNKKYMSSKYRKTTEKFESDESEVSDNVSDELYDSVLGHRSPLQIEIENDEYFENNSDNSL